MYPASHPPPAPITFFCDGGLITAQLAFAHPLKQRLCQGHEAGIYSRVSRGGSRGKPRQARRGSHSVFFQNAQAAGGYSPRDVVVKVTVEPCGQIGGFHSVKRGHQPRKKP